MKYLFQQNLTLPIQQVLRVTWDCHVLRDAEHTHDVTHTRTTKRIQWGFAQKPEAASSFLI